MSSIKITLTQNGDTSVITQIGDHQLIVDRPLEKGGGNAGPMGGQFLLTGVGGCFCSTFYAVVKSRNVEVTGLKVIVTATMSEDLPQRFEDISIECSYENCSHPKEFDKLLSIAEKGCLSINTIKQGVTLKVNDKT